MPSESIAILQHCWMLSIASQLPLHQRKELHIKKIYHSGGGCHFIGLPMQADDGNSLACADYNLYYKCDTQNQWLSMLNFTVVEKEEENELQLFLSY